jgi:hypothetical protein
MKSEYEMRIHALEVQNEELKVSNMNRKMEIDQLCDILTGTQENLRRLAENVQTLTDHLLKQAGITP